jgi:tRNA uridine 5-carboxymethylaminomethyl modification enzyme
LGPRYCPSIEDKIDRFAEKDRHQIFVEPEGWDTVEIYVNGFSTSLPEDVQLKAMRKIPGFEHAKMFRPGYAIEYDYFPPTQLSYSLETKLVKNLFFAGQINGTTGYEEAAGQGLIAGINAHNSAHDKEFFTLGRNEAYIGVLIDDLITKGTEEPYRMFTSRAEYRILLRQDNADIRLTEKAYKIGLAKEDRMKRVEEKNVAVASLTKFIHNTSVNPEEVNELLINKSTAAINQKVKLDKLVLRPQLSIKEIAEKVESLAEEIKKYDKEMIESAEIHIKYEGYLAKEMELVEKMTRLEDIKLVDKLDYMSIQSLSMEARTKLTKIKPETLGQASRISGVSPADISVLMIYVGR